MLARLIGLLRSRPNYRPPVAIFTRDWRPDDALRLHRTRPKVVFYRRRGKGQREQRKPSRRER